MADSFTVGTYGWSTPRTVGVYGWSESDAVALARPKIIFEVNVTTQHLELVLMPTRQQFTSYVATQLKTEQSVATQSKVESNVATQVKTEPSIATQHSEVVNV